MRWIAIATVVAGAACGPGLGKTGYLLIDGEALRSGASVQVGNWRGSPVLPIATDVGDSVHVDGRLVQVEPGTLVHIRGPRLDFERLRLGVNVKEDALIVDAPEPAVQRLAGVVDARYEPAPRGFLLTGRELLDRVSFLRAPEEVRESMPAQVDTAMQVPAGGERPLDLMVERSAPAQVALFVGFYANGEETLILDAEGGFRLFAGCGGLPLTGLYRQDDSQLVLTPREGSPILLPIKGPKLGDYEEFGP